MVDQLTTEQSKRVDFRVENCSADELSFIKMKIENRSLPKGELQVPLQYDDKVLQVEFFREGQQQSV